MRSIVVCSIFELWGCNQSFTEGGRAETGVAQASPGVQVFLHSPQEFITYHRDRNIKTV